MTSECVLIAVVLLLMQDCGSTLCRRWTLPLPGLSKWVNRLKRSRLGLGEEEQFQTAYVCSACLTSKGRGQESHWGDESEFRRNSQTGDTRMEMVLKAMQLDELSHGSEHRQKRKQAQDQRQDSKGKTPREAEIEQPERSEETRRAWQPEATWRGHFQVELSALSRERILSVGSWGYACRTICALGRGHCRARGQKVEKDKLTEIGKREIGGSWYLQLFKVILL